MRHHRLFAAGLAAALMLGAASPALAAPGKSQGKSQGKAKGHVNKPEKTKPPKKAPPATKGKKYGVSGGGSVANGEFSIQARPNSKSKGHFNYTSTDGLFKVRCRGFDTFDAPTGLYPRTQAVKFNNCRVTGLTDGGSVTVTVTDGGQHPTPPATDSIDFSIGLNTYGGALTDGNVKIR